MADIVMEFKAVYAAYPRCLPVLVGYIWHRSDTGRRWFQPLNHGGCK